MGHCATSWKVAGSIPDGVIGIFHWHNPSGSTMALASTQPLTEMSTRNISWAVKAADSLTTFVCRLSWNLGSPTPRNPRGLSRLVMGLLYLFTLLSGYLVLGPLLFLQCYSFTCRYACSCCPVRYGRRFGLGRVVVHKTWPTYAGTCTQRREQCIATSKRAHACWSTHGKLAFMSADVVVINTIDSASCI